MALNNAHVLLAGVRGWRPVAGGLWLVAGGQWLVEEGRGVLRTLLPSPPLRAQKAGVGGVSRLEFAAMKTDCSAVHTCRMWLGAKGV